MLPNFAFPDTIKPFSDFRSRTQLSLSVRDTSNDGKYFESFSGVGFGDFPHLRGSLFGDVDLSFGVILNYDFRTPYHSRFIPPI
jgi:hypothetical protein